MGVHSENIEEKIPSAPAGPTLPPLTDADWRTLETEGEHARPDLLDRTIHEDDHPEWYEGPCLCMECLSYGE